MLVNVSCSAGVSDASSVVVGSVLGTSVFSFHRWLASVKRQAPCGQALSASTTALSASTKTPVVTSSR